VLHATAAFILGERVCGTHSIGVWVVHRAGLEQLWRSENSLLYTCRVSNPSRPARNVVSTHTPGKGHGTI